MNYLMRTTRYFLFERLGKLPRTHLITLAFFTVLLCWVLNSKPSSNILINHTHTKASEPAIAQADKTALLSDGTDNDDSSELALASDYQETRVIISKGDTLSAIFERLNISQNTLYDVLSADESALALETLKPNNHLIFRYHSVSHDLQQLELFIHSGHRVVYRRVEDGGIEYESIIRDGQWRTKLVSGVIKGSFYLSAQAAGLTEADAATVTKIFKEQLNFSRAIRKGDKFQVLKKEQFVDGEATGQSHIVSARLQQSTNEYTAFLFDDGRFYDKHGKSLTRAFRRLPLAQSYRVSSHFNPKRKHPVTGRIRPHNGTDFATPTGTKILSTGDGVVTRVGNHRFAGKYIDIEHSSKYKTRYLHLHKINVRKGQTVKRGQVIALSGNTGRSTGPHLHFELHIDGRPVNPLKAKIPLSKALTERDKSAFLKQVAMRTTLLDGRHNIDVEPEQALILAD